MLARIKVVLLLGLLLLNACANTELTITPEPQAATASAPVVASLPSPATPLPEATVVQPSPPPTATVTRRATSTGSPVPAGETATGTAPAQAAQPSPSPESTPLEGLGDTWTRPFDEMLMVLVPGGAFAMGSSDAEVKGALARCRESYRYCNLDFYGQEAPQHSVHLDAFWIDRTEVTQAQYNRCVEAGKCQAPPACADGEAVAGDARNEDHPVVCVDWQDAHTYCAWAGSRLPTEAEWEYAARGPDGHLYPWGNEPERAGQNYCDAVCSDSWADESVDDGYPRTSPVDSYPEGVSWCGAADMAGNVYEWVADWLGPYSSRPGTNPTGAQSGYERVLRGSSWKSFWDRARGATRDSVSPDSRYDHIGFRCARGIEAPKVAAKELPDSTGTSPPDAASLADGWIRPTDGMVMAYVPGGRFPMGSTEAEVDAVLSSCGEYADPYGKCKPDAFEAEPPRHDVTLDDFWIDGTEVTNALYNLCVDAGACRRSKLADDPAYNQDDYPVAGIPQQDAAAYCAWAGGRLPTEAEWEYAARGVEGSVFPWGEGFDCAGGNFGDDITGCDDGYAGPAPVGSFPAGTSWCGAQDLAGNVWEWVADWHGAYPSEAVVDPTGPASGAMGILRGGSWAYYAPFLRAAFRYPVPPAADYLAVGFRCVVPASE